jgi:hypothetical protein
MDIAISAIEPRLDPGEKLLWAGQPKQGVRLQPQDVFLIPFSLFWGGFAFVWETIAILGVLGFLSPHHNGGAPEAMIMPIFGIPFVLIGLYLIVGRFFYDAASRRKTFYAVTDRRAIILKEMWSINVMSYDFYSLGTLNLTERADGSGAILFGNSSPFSMLSTAGWPGMGRYTVPGFYLLPDAKNVYNFIRQAQSQARER